MARRPVVAVLAVSAGLVTSALLASPAVAGPVHELQALTVTPAAVSVAGFGSVPVEVTATVRVDDSISTCAEEPYAHGGGLAAYLKHAGPAAFGVQTEWQVDLTLVAGTKALGTWKGTWDVPSTAGGTWVVDRLLACTESTSMVNPDGFDIRPADVGKHPVVVVTGTKPPTMSVTRTPSIAPYGGAQLIRWTFRNASGTKLAGRKIALGTDTTCGFWFWGDRLATLDSNGSFALYRSAANASGKGDRCVILRTKADGTGAFMLSDRSMNRWYFKTVTAKLSASTVKAGSATTASGVVAPNRWSASWGPKAGLQRYQNGKWKGISIVPVTSKGTYALTVKPPTKGTWWFRVIAIPGPYDQDLVVTATKAFPVKAV